MFLEVLETGYFNACLPNGGSQLWPSSLFSDSIRLI